MAKNMALIFLFFFFNAIAKANPIYLSDYLGVASGNTTFSGDGIYSTVQTASPWGFGGDIAGSWVSAGDAISLNYGGVSTEFVKGVGAHPTFSGEARIDFQLNKFRNDGLSFNNFHAIVGIDEFSGGSAGSLTNGATFNVYLDDFLVESIAVSGTSAGAFLVDVNILDTNQVLSLGTSKLGLWSNNHAAWGDAQINITSTEVSEPNTIWILTLGITVIATALCILQSI